MRRRRTTSANSTPTTLPHPATGPGAPAESRCTAASFVRSFPGSSTGQSIHTLDEHPDRRYVITKRETDPDILAAFAPLMGEDEQLGHGPADMFPTHVCACGGRSK
jgi:hypothetical protein